MKPTVINNTNSGNDINNYSEPNVNNNPDIHHAHHQQQPHPQQQQHPQPQSTPQGIYHDNNGLAGGGANSRRFPFYPTGFDFFDDDDMFPDSGVRSRLNRMRDPWGTWGRKRRSSQEHITPEQTQAGGVPQPSAQVPQPDEGYEDDFFPQMQQPWADATFGRGQRKRNPHLDDDDDFFSYIPQQFRQYIPNNFQFPRMRSHFARPQMAQPAPAAHSPQNRNYFPQQQPQPQQQAQQHPVHQEPHMGKPKFCDAAMQTDFDQSHPDGQAEQPNLNQHGLRNTIDMGQKTNDECDDAGPRARSAPPDQNYQNDPNQFASAQSFSSATGFPGQKPQVYAQASATPGAHAQAHAQAQTANMGTNTSPGTPNGGNLYRQYYYPFDSNNTSQANSQARQPPQQAPPQQPQTPTQEGQFIRTVPIVIESRKVPPKPKPQTPPVQQPHTQPQHQQQSPPQAHAQPQQNTQNREIPIRVEHSKTQNQAPPQPQTSPQSPPPQQQQAEPEAPKTTLPPDSITKIQAIQKEVMELMFAVEQFKGKGRDKEYIYLDEMLTRNLIKLDDIETDGKENIRLARKEAIKCIQASLCVLEMKADGRIPENESKPEESNTKGEVEEVASGPQPPVTEAEPTTEDTSTLEKPELPAESTTATATTTHEKTDENVTEKKDEPTETAIINDKATSSPTIEKNKEKPIDEENKSETVQEPEPAAPKANETEPAAAEGAEVKPAEST